MGKRLPRKGELVLTANYVTGYSDSDAVTNQLAIVNDAYGDSTNGQVVRAKLLSSNIDIILFEDEYIYPDEEQANEGG